MGCDIIIPVMKSTHHHTGRGFTLLEIMVVVLMIGILLAMAIPGFKAVRERARISTFTSDFRAVKEAVNRFNLSEGYYPLSGGAIEPEFFDYMRQDVITETTVIGGNWNFDDSTAIFAIGIVGYEVEDDIVERIDSAVDDGILTTGSMTKTSDGEFYFVIEE